MMGCCRGDAELAVRMLDDPEPFEVSRLAEVLEPGKGADPVGTETIDVGRAPADLPVGVLGRPESLVGTDRYGSPCAHFLHAGSRVGPDRLFDEVNSVRIQPGQVPERLVHRPGAIGIQADLRARAYGLAYTANHFHLGVDVDADFQVKDMKACRQAFAALFLQARLG